jgi:hypothetical protein
MGGNWLAAKFVVLGIHFQVWMPGVLAIVLVAIVIALLTS